MSRENKVISPWAMSVQLPSPDKRHSAQIYQAEEIAMGAPTSGVLETDNFKWNYCNPSIVWSNDSRFIAVPQWTESFKQNLIIIEMQNFSTYIYPKEFRVLELHGFKDGIITGIDSPIYKPEEIKISGYRFLRV